MQSNRYRGSAVRETAPEGKIKMAYMDQKRKAEIKAGLVKVMPKDWRWSLGVEHHSTIVLTIWEAPVDLIAERNSEYATDGYADVNPYHVDTQFKSAKLVATFKAILAVMNAGNHNNSDMMTDYFDVGWYVAIRIGRWNKKFQFVPKTEAQKELEKYWAGSVTASYAEKIRKGEYTTVIAGEQPQPGSSAYEALKAQVAALEVLVAGGAR